MIRVHRLYHLPAAHVLASDRLSDEENRRIFGKCANPAGHGHNYGIEVAVSGPVQESTGQIIPVDELDGIFDREVRAAFSHTLLNDHPAFRSRVSTAENIALVVHEILREALEKRGGPHLAGVRIVETARNSCETGDYE